VTSIAFSGIAGAKGAVQWELIPEGLAETSEPQAIGMSRPKM
jgi:hypothetical protein